MDTGITGINTGVAGMDTGVTCVYSRILYNTNII